MRGCPSHFIGALVAAACMLASATVAFAHASLVSAEPRDGGMLAQAPSQFTLTFNEPVAPLVVRLIASDGQRNDLAVTALDRTLTLTPSRPLGQGSYVLSWRVVSSDGHPVGGSLVFAVGQAAEARPAGSGQTDTEWPVRAAIWFARVAIYLGLFVGIGGAVFSAWGGSALPRAAEITIAGSLGVALAAVPLSIGLQGLDALAAPLLDLWDPAVCVAGFRTSYGNTALVAGTALIGGLVALLWRNETASRALSLLALVGAGAALTISGHASAATPQILMRPSVFLHVCAVALWIGSLVPLYALLRGRRSVSVPLRRFGQAMPVVLVPLLVSGIVLAVVQLGHFEALWTTAYGRVFMLKCAALVALAALAAINRFVLTPAFIDNRRNARPRLARSIAAEIVLALIIFGLAAFWRFTPPPRALDLGEPAFVHLHTEQAMVDITLTPGRVGPLALQVRVMREDFSPLSAKEVSVSLSNKSAGIEPLRRSATRNAEGFWTIENILVPASGIWTIEVDLLVDDFTRIDLDGPIVIAR